MSETVQKPARKPLTFDDPVRAAVSPAPAPAAVVPQASTGPRKRKSERHVTRVGKRGVQFWTSPEVFRQLKVICAREDRSVQAALAEALDMFFQSRGETRIAVADLEATRRLVGEEDDA